MRAERERPVANARPSPWRRLWEDDEWLLLAVLAFLEDGGDELHWLWLLAVDDGLTSLRARLEQHVAVSTRHARRLAMTHSMWSVLLQLSASVSYTKGQRLSSETVDGIEQALAQRGVAPHPDRRRVLLTAVGLAHKSGEWRAVSCPYCARTHSHRCRGGFHRCTGAGPGPQVAQHFCREVAHCAMYAAARDGRLESVVWLHYVVCYDQEKALSLAARHGHVHVVTWLLDHAHGNNITLDFRDDDLGIVCWRTKPFSQNYTMTKHWGVDQALSDYVSACLAAKHGDVDGLQRLYAHPSGFFRTEFTSRLASYAASSGHVAVLDLLFERCPEIFEGSSAMWSALKNGHFEVAQWLISHGCDTVNDIRNVRPAVLNGRVDVLQWMLANASDPGPLRREMIARSTERTSQPVLEWLARDHGLKLTTTTHAREATVRRQTELVKWIVTRCTARRPLQNGRALLEAAIKTDNLELVRWFVEELAMWSPEAFPLASVGRSQAMLAYIYAAAQSLPPLSSRHPVVAAKRRLGFNPNCLDTIEWLLDHGYRSGLFESGALDAVLQIERDSAAAQHAMGTNPAVHRPQTMRRFRATICRLVHVYDVAYIRRVQWLPMWAAQHGSLDTLKRLMEIDNRNMFTRKRFDTLLQQTAREPVVKWLLEQKPELFTTLVVRWAVRHGKRGVLKWVFQCFLPAHAELLDADPTLLLRKCVGTALWHARRGHDDHVQVMMQEWTPVARDPTLWRRNDLAPSDAADPSTVKAVYRSLSAVWALEMLAGFHATWRWRHSHHDGEMWSRTKAIRIALAGFTAPASRVQRAVARASGRAGGSTSIATLTSPACSMQPPPPEPDPTGSYVLFFDGSSCGNPGLGGSGSVIIRVTTNGSIATLLWNAAMSLASRTTTNNLAEYIGLVTGLRAAHAHRWSRLSMVGDSMLVIRQLAAYRPPRNPRPRAQYETARLLADKIGVARWIHHLCAWNKMADAGAATPNTQQTEEEKPDKEKNTEEEEFTHAQRLALLPAPAEAFYAGHGLCCLHYNLTVPKKDDRMPAPGLKLGAPSMPPSKLPWARIENPNVLATLAVVSFPMTLQWKAYKWAHQRVLDTTP